MEIAINKAKGKLSGLINAALKGEKVVLTKHGAPVAEIKPISPSMQPAEKLAAIRKIVKQAQAKYTEGPDAAHSADFLYDDEGMPS